MKSFTKNSLHVLLHLRTLPVLPAETRFSIYRWPRVSNARTREAILRASHLLMRSSSDLARRGAACLIVAQAWVWNVSLHTKAELNEPLLVLIKHIYLELKDEQQWKVEQFVDFQAKQCFGHYNLIIGRFHHFPNVEMFSKFRKRKSIIYLVADIIAAFNETSNK